VPELTASKIHTGNALPIGVARKAIRGIEGGAGVNIRRPVCLLLCVKVGNQSQTYENHRAPVKTWIFVPFTK
jgi:hypothetical protein